MGLSSRNSEFYHHHKLIFGLKAVTYAYYITGSHNILILCNSPYFFVRLFLLFCTRPGSWLLRYLVWIWYLYDRVFPLTRHLGDLSESFGWLPLVVDGSWGSEGTSPSSISGGSSGISSNGSSTVGTSNNGASDNLALNSNKSGVMSDSGYGWGGNSLGNGNGGSSNGNSWSSGNGATSNGSTSDGSVSGSVSCSVSDSSDGWGSGDGRGSSNCWGGGDGWGSNGDGGSDGLKVDVGLSCWIGLARCVMHILLSGDLLVDVLNGSRGIVATSIARGIMDVGLSSGGSITASISGGIMDVGLGSWVELSSDIKGGWESSTDGGNSTSVSNASISAIGRSSSSVSTIDGGSGWSSSNGWGGSNSWGGSVGDCRGWGSSNANWAKGLTTTSSKVLGLSNSHSRLIIGGDSAIEVNLQSKRSSTKSLRTSIATIGNSRGSSNGRGSGNGWGSSDSWSWCNGVGSGRSSNGRGSNSSSSNNTSGIA